MIVTGLLGINITLDFIAVNSAQGDAGAERVKFSDHVGAPVQEGLQLAHNTVIGINLCGRISIFVPDKAERGRNFYRSTINALQAA